MAAYHEAMNRPPESLRALVQAGLLPDIPLDPDGKPYVLDAETGEPLSTTPFRLRRR